VKQQSNGTFLGSSEFTSEEVEDFCLRFALYDIQDELADILLSKHNDYGPKNITVCTWRCAQWSSCPYA